MIYSNTAVYGQKECGKSGHLSNFFTSLKHLIMLMKCTFFQDYAAQIFFLSSFSTNAISWLHLMRLPNSNNYIRIIAFLP